MTKYGGLLGPDQFSNRRVPGDARTTWHRVALINVAVALSLPTFVVGIEIANSLAPRDFIIAIVFGFLVIAVIASLVGVVGTRTHFSSYLLARIAFGQRGAAVVNVAFAISLLGWFGVNIDLFSDAVARLSQQLFAWQPPNRLVEIAGGVLMTTTAVFGFRAIAVLSAWAVPLIVAVALWMAFNLWTMPTPVPQMAAEGPMISLGAAISAAVGSIIVGSIIMPDTTRFIDGWAGAVKVSVVAFLVVTVAVSLIAGLSSYMTGTSGVLDTMLEMNLGIGAFVIVIAGCWVLNALNLYSCSLAFKASFTRQKGSAPVIVAGCIGVVAASFNILDRFLDFLLYLSMAFVPVAGVILVDYTLVGRSRYERPLEAPRERDWSYRALGAWMSGAAASLLAERLGLTLTSVPACDALAVAALAYWILSKLWAPRLERLSP